MVKKLHALVIGTSLFTMLDKVVTCERRDVCKIDAGALELHVLSECYTRHEARSGMSAHLWEHLT